MNEEFQHLYKAFQFGFDTKKQAERGLHQTILTRPGASRKVFRKQCGRGAGERDFIHIDKEAGKIILT